MQRRNVIVTNNPGPTADNTDLNTKHRIGNASHLTCVKSERLSPKPNSQTDDSRAASNSKQENTSKAEGERQIRDNSFGKTVPTSKQPPFETDFRQAGDQLLSSVFSPASVAAALFSRHMQQNGMHKPKPGYILPLSDDVSHLAFSRAATMPNNRIFSRKNFNDTSSLDCQSSLGSVQLNATSSSAGKININPFINTLSKHGTCGEPLDLSQNKVDSNQLSVSQK